jgi:hypothetical protein
MLRRLQICASLALLLLVGGSTRRTPVELVLDHTIAIEAAPLFEPTITLSPELRFVRGWSLTSDDADFGGLSGLMSDGVRFTAISDKGLFVSFSLDESSGAISRARVSPLPKGCANDNFKTDRDTEAFVRDPVKKKIWIGFEWRNVICRSGDDLKSKEILGRPAQMQGWPRAGGLEAMALLKDGRFLLWMERPANSSFTSPALLYPGDPAAPGATAVELSYKLPVDYFRPTDAATLPDGRVLVLHRNFKPPIRFRAKLGIMDAPPAKARATFTSRIIASFDETGLTDNMEGIAVSQRDGRTFVWMVSDNNYVWLQHTYLLQFELVPTPTADSGSDGG